MYILGNKNKKSHQIIVPQATRAQGINELN